MQYSPFINSSLNPLSTLFQPSFNSLSTTPQSSFRHLSIFKQPLAYLHFIFTRPRTTNLKLSFFFQMNFHFPESFYSATASTFSLVHQRPLTPIFFFRHTKLLSQNSFTPQSPSNHRFSPIFSTKPPTRNRYHNRHQLPQPATS